mmetsp:Transcript_3691/g.5513  ORF Transcript_3691/g.5513 Transcript_3691/m.5513 type:complete len:324 (-) Transcript_3691:669-1640(-)
MWENNITNFLVEDCSPLEDGMDRFVDMANKASAESSSSPSALLLLMDDIVQQALSHPRIYVGFLELKAAALFPVEAQRTLDLFAHGTYMDYCQKKHDKYYLPLTSNQVFKLQQLTVVTIVLRYITTSQQQNQNSNTVPYDTLQEACMDTTVVDAIHSRRQLEHLLLFLIQNSIVSGKLDQKKQRLVLIPNEIFGYCIARDLILDDNLVYNDMIQKLQSFQQSTNSLIHTIHQQMEQLNRNKNRYVETWTQVDDFIAKMNNNKNSNSSKVKSGKIVGAAEEEKNPELLSEASGQQPPQQEYYARDASRRSKRSRGGAGVSEQEV